MKPDSAGVFVIYIALYFSTLKQIIAIVPHPQTQQQILANALLPCWVEDDEFSPF